MAGLLAGALDITFAFIFYGGQGARPTRLLRGMPAVSLSAGAYTLGSWSIALGAALHFFIAVCAAFVFYAASRRFPVLARRPLPSGTAFRVAMYRAMHFIGCRCRE